MTTSFPNFAYVNSNSEMPHELGFHFGFDNSNKRTSGNYFAGSCTDVDDESSSAFDESPFRNPHNGSFSSSDSLSSIKFSSRLQLTESPGPSQQQRRCLQWNTPGGFSPSQNMYGSPSALSFGEQVSCDQQRMGFGQNTMQHYSDDCGYEASGQSDDEVSGMFLDSAGFLNDPSSTLPPLQEYAASCNWNERPNVGFGAAVPPSDFTSMQSEMFEMFDPSDFGWDSRMNVDDVEPNGQLTMQNYFQPSPALNNGMAIAEEYEDIDMEMCCPTMSSVHCEDAFRNSFDSSSSMSACADPTIIAEDFEFQINSHQLGNVRGGKVEEVLHGSGTLRRDVNEWMDLPVNENEDNAFGPSGMFDFSDMCHEQAPRNIDIQRPQSTPLSIGSSTPNKSKKEWGGKITCDPTELALPVSKMTDDGCRCVSPSTMLDLMNGKYSDKIDHFVVIDCRFTYEYTNGHIKEAIHVQDQDLLKRMYDANKKLCSEQKLSIAWIFHCEFSQQRGPETATWFRKHDRTEHLADYPNVTFPNVYVLEGGYQAFWNVYSTHPQANQIFGREDYVSMWASEFDVSRQKHTKLRHELWGGGKGSRKNKSRQRIPRRSLSVGPEDRRNY